MTESSEAGAEPTTTTTAGATALPNQSEGSSRWSRLNRTNRIAALVLGGIAAVFVAALIFGAGVLVGAEGSEGEHHHHGGDGSSEYRDGNRDQSDENDGGNGDSGSDSGRDQSDEGRGSEVPKTPTPTSATPRP